MKGVVEAIIRKQITGIAPVKIRTLEVKVKDLLLRFEGGNTSKSDVFFGVIYFFKWQTGRPYRPYSPVNKITNQEFITHSTV